VADVGQLAGAVELLDGNGALALVADVDQHLARAHVDDTPTHDLALFELAGGVLAVPVLHAFLGRVLAASPSRGSEDVSGFIGLHATGSSRPYIWAKSGLLPHPPRRLLDVHRRRA